ncbi:DUF6461 domain-containing protein [Sphaerisporangium perillae]|uniref:DUF6461 domain-containing protein n=1 Tax=Sphaerisporangium perillae TaxID=2935860 RepID=UPI00200DB341|nr:DUF6461 domain-containing protein [Sphaerisporangium perillae]
MTSSFTAYERLRHLFPDQCCLTWIRTGESDAAFADLVCSFGGAPSTVHAATWDEVEGEAYEDLDEEADGIMLAARHSPWTVVMEPFNARGTSMRMLREVAAGSQAYNVWWTVNRQVSVSYVADGELVATFEPANLEAITPRSGRDWLAGLAVTEEQWRRNWFAAALAAGEELSGVRLDGQWLKQEHLGVQLYPLPSRAVTSADLLDADMRAIAERDPRIGVIAADPTPDKLPEIIRVAAELAVATTGLEGPLIDEAMRFIAAGDRGKEAQEVRGRLFRLRDRYRAEARRGPDLVPGHDSEHGPLLKERAVQALIYALKSDVDLAEAAQDTVQAAGETHLSEENGDHQRERVLNVITYYLRTGMSPR